MRCWAVSAGGERVGIGSLCPASEGFRSSCPDQQQRLEENYMIHPVDIRLVSLIRFQAKVSICI